MKILYIEPIHESGMNKLASKYDVVIAPDTSHATLKNYIVDADAVITRLTVIDAALMSIAKNLKVVCKHGVGLDNIDVEYAKSKGIEILTTGDANSTTVAEHAMFAIGALFKNIIYLNQEMRKGNWKSRDIVISSDVRGKTLGLAGFGRIGSNLASMAKYGFKMNVLVYDPYVEKKTVEEQGYTYCEKLDDMLRHIDILSIHVPLTEETRNMINTRELALMKNGSYVINFARGGIVNEQALISALDSGHIAGSALDVFEQEPPDETNPLMNHSKVILSPHCATFTEDSRYRMSMRLADGIDRILQQGVKK